MPSNYLVLCHHLLFLPSVFPASGPFPMSQFFASGGQGIGTSASVLPMKILSPAPPPKHHEGRVTRRGFRTFRGQLDKLACDSGAGYSPWTLTPHHCPTPVFLPYIRSQGLQSTPTQYSRCRYTDQLSNNNKLMYCHDCC